MVTKTKGVGKLGNGEHVGKKVFMGGKKKKRGIKCWGGGGGHKATVGEEKR